MDAKEVAERHLIYLECDDCWDGTCANHFFPPRVSVRGLINNYAALASLYEEKVGSEVGDTDWNRLGKL